MELMINILGWVGSVVVVLAYGLNITKRMKSGSLSYIFLNLIGGILLIIYTVYTKNYPSAFINVVWAVVAFGSVVGYFRAKKSNQKEA
jgi:VIT1/CCC1 family predicted Fe2+/Mn2+ transporter